MKRRRLRTDERRTIMAEARRRANTRGVSVHLCVYDGPSESVDKRGHTEPCGDRIRLREAWVTPGMVLDVDVATNVGGSYFGHFETVEWFEWTVPA